MYWQTIQDKEPYDGQDIIVKGFTYINGRHKVYYLAGIYEKNIKRRGQTALSNKYGMLEVYTPNSVSYYDFEEWMPVPKDSHHIFVS